MEKPLQGSLTISCPMLYQGEGKDRYVEIRVSDCSSGTGVIELALPLHIFSLALFGQQDVPVTYWLAQHGLLGKHLQFQDIVIPWLGWDHRDEREEVVVAWVKHIDPYLLIDGWELNDWREMFNMHNRTREMVRMTLYRYLDHEPAQRRLKPKLYPSPEAVETSVAKFIAALPWDLQKKPEPKKTATKKAKKARAPTKRRKVKKK